MDISYSTPPPAPLIGNRNLALSSLGLLTHCGQRWTPFCVNLLANGGKLLAIPGRPALVLLRPAKKVLPTSKSITIGETVVNVVKLDEMGHGRSCKRCQRRRGLLHVDVPPVPSGVAGSSSSSPPHVPFIPIAIAGTTVLLLVHEVDASIVVLRVVDDSTVKLLSVNRPWSPKRSGGGPVRAAWSWMFPDRLWLSHGQTLVAVSLSSMTEVSSNNGPAGLADTPISAIATNGSHAIVAHESGAVLVYDVRSASSKPLSFTRLTTDEPVRCFAWLSDRHVLAVAGDEALVMLSVPDASVVWIEQVTHRLVGDPVVLATSPFQCGAGEGDDEIVWPTAHGCFLSINRAGVTEVVPGWGDFSHLLVGDWFVTSELGPDTPLPNAQPLSTSSRLWTLHEESPATSGAVVASAPFAVSLVALDDSLLLRHWTPTAFSSYDASACFLSEVPGVPGPSLVTLMDARAGRWAAVLRFEDRFDALWLGGGVDPFPQWVHPLRPDADELRVEDAKLNTRADPKVPGCIVVTEEVVACAITADGGVVALLGCDGVLSLVSTDASVSVSHAASPVPQEVTDGKALLVFSADSSLLFLALASGTVLVTESTRLADWQVVATLDGGGSPTFLAPAGDTSCVAATSSDVYVVADGTGIAGRWQARPGRSFVRAAGASVGDQAVCHVADDAGFVYSYVVGSPTARSEVRLPLDELAPAVPTEAAMEFCTVRFDPASAETPIVYLSLPQLGLARASALSDDAADAPHAHYVTLRLGERPDVSSLLGKLLGNSIQPAKELERVMHRLLAAQTKVDERAALLGTAASSSSTTRASATSTGASSAAGQARDKMRQNVDKAREVEEATADLADESANFASLSKQLAQSQSSWWKW